MKRDHDAIRAELELLKEGGVIKPSDVVEAARSKRSALHNCFTWSNDEAAHQFRLLEARNLLRVYVVQDESTPENVRAFVSLSTDRTQEGGGYRAMSDVMGDDELRAQLLKDAFVQFRNMQERYRHLQQLAGVWREVAAAEVAVAQEKPRRVRKAKGRKIEKAKAA